MEKTGLPIIKFDSETIQPRNLNQFTFARVGLTKTGQSISMKDLLAFRVDYASAKDALNKPFDIDQIKNSLGNLKMESIVISSQAVSKAEYLQRPDLGRLPILHDLNLLKHYENKKYDVVFVITNGLSAQAVNEHAGPLLNHLIPKVIEAGYSVSPLVFVNNGRVGIADAIGEKLNARLSIILVGERPGLSSPDSMGAYLTYEPKTGLTDEKRNCISNIRTKGLPPFLASQKLIYLINEAFIKQLSGVHLKDEMRMID